jgi:hypothetical protein
MRAQLLGVTVLALGVRQGDLLEQVRLVESADDLERKRWVKMEEERSLPRRSRLVRAGPWGCGRPGSGRSPARSGRSAARGSGEGRASLTCSSTSLTLSCTKRRLVSESGTYLRVERDVDGGHHAALHQLLAPCEHLAEEDYRKNVKDVQRWK